MRYLLLCCFNERQWAELPDDRRDGIMREYGEWLRRLDASGQHLPSAQLHPSTTATTLRGTNSGVTIVDGPFAETKEQLGGYHLIECRDLDEAIAIAGRIPTIPYGGAVEVRPLLEP